MEALKYGIGIDMAKDKFDCCIATITGTQLVEVKAQAQFHNTAAGFEAFLQWSAKIRKLPQLPVAYLMEATGIYYESLAWHLHTRQCSVAVVLPNKARKYKEALGLKSKTDRIDARGLSRMACEQAHTPWRPLSDGLYTLRLITRQIESISTQATATSNSLHALTYGMFRDEEVEQMHRAQLELLAEQKKALQDRIAQIIAADPALKVRFERILAIKGLGIQSLAVVVAETAGFAAFESASQLVSYAGYDVVENQSGNRAGKTSISKKGNAHIRRAMYFPALNMVTYDVGSFGDLYRRIYERSGIRMKGYVAVQKKLLTLIYALWTREEAFDPEHHKKQALVQEQEEAGKRQASGDMEPVPSLATGPCAEPARAPQQKQKQKRSPLKKVTPTIKTGDTEDKHPSKPRRTPSLAKPKIKEKYLT